MSLWIESHKTELWRCHRTTCIGTQP